MEDFMMEMLNQGTSEKASILSIEEMSNAFGGKISCKKGYSTDKKGKVKCECSYVDDDIVDKPVTGQWHV